jgi:hypothetical protein
VAILAQALLALVGSNFMTLSFFTAGHNAWGLSWVELVLVCAWPVAQLVCYSYWPGD